MGLIALFPLEPVEVALDHLVVFRAIGRQPQRCAHLADALVADLGALERAGAVGPGVVGYRVADGFVLLVTETAVDLTIGRQRVTAPGSYSLALNPGLQTLPAGSTLERAAA
jgi:hypothetical protein